MNPAYENAVRMIAEAYTSERESFGGRSLARIATIVTNNGSFFVRVASGKTFSVANLEKVAAWFRDPANWPDGSIPQPAVAALASIGRPPISAAAMPHPYRTPASHVRSNDTPALDRAGRV